MLPLSTTVLALLTALVSVVSLALPQAYGWVHKNASHASLILPVMDGATLRLVATNSGDAPAILARAMTLEHSGPEILLRLTRTEDSFIPTGSHQVAYAVIPLLEAKEARALSERIIADINSGKAPEPLIVQIRVIQYDQKNNLHHIRILPKQLAVALRYHADHCDSLDIKTVEDGCSVVRTNEPAPASSPA